jgi:hypothetical protein
MDCTGLAGDDSGPGLRRLYDLARRRGRADHQWTKAVLRSAASGR